MKFLLSLCFALIVGSLASCGPMTLEEYNASKSKQQQEYPKLLSIYRKGQSPAQVRASLQKAKLSPLLGERTAHRPTTGWANRSWELYEEQSTRSRVTRVDRFAFGGISYMAPVVYYHRVFYDGQGRSSGWYVTHD
jgi:hypothetical protein